jgi:CRISPR system Cascade subunit CasD
MMKEYLIFRLYGPIASWGEIAVGENRHSFSYPSKSAIIGLIASAFGYKREQEEKHRELSESLGFGVKVWNSGILLRDYHTIQTPPSKGNVIYATRKDELRDKLDSNGKSIPTILSSRDYRMDALYDISIWPRNDSIRIEEIQQKLNEPNFSLFLGRKSCVIASPLFASLVNGEDLFLAFAKYTDDLRNKFKEENIEYFFETIIQASSFNEYVWEDESKDKSTEMRTRRDGVLSRKRWQFSERKEFYKSEVKQNVPIQS